MQNTFRLYIAKQQEFPLTSNGRLSIKDDLANNWQSIFENAHFEKVDSIDTLEKKMSEYGNGARAEVYVQWINSGAHVFVAEQINGKTLYFDPQTGEKSAENYFTNVKKGSIMLCWIDNLSPSKLISNCCKKK